VHLIIVLSREGGQFVIATILWGRQVTITSLQKLVFGSLSIRLL
jgi:hypothetical protein